MFINSIAICRVRTLHKSMSSEALGNFYKFYTISNNESRFGDHQNYKEHNVYSIYGAR